MELCICGSCSLFIGCSGWKWSTSDAGMTQKDFEDYLIHIWAGQAFPFLVLSGDSCLDAIYGVLAVHCFSSGILLIILLLLKYLKPQHIHMSKDQSATFFVWNAAFSIMKYGYNEPWGRCPVAEFVDPFLRSCRGWPFFSATKKLKGRETGSAQILHVWCKFTK